MDIKTRNKIELYLSLWGISRSWLLSSTDLTEIKWGRGPSTGQALKEQGMAALAEGLSQLETSLNTEQVEN